MTEFDPELDRRVFEAGEILGKLLGWREWVDALPYLSFPRGWRVKIIPPFGGAQIRFYVTKTGLTKHQYVSVYFDTHRILGISDEPYWEVYPGGKYDTARFILGEEKEMIREIGRALRRMKRREVQA